MVRLFSIALFLLTPFAAVARCDGVDVIAALPAADQMMLEDRANAVAYPEGLLWQATKGDTKFTLFGTYHFEHEQTAAHMALLAPFIDQSDLIYLEMSKADQKELQREIARDPSVMFIMQGKTLPDLLGPEDWRRYADEMRARSIPGFMAAKYKPVWAAMTLGIGPCEARHALKQPNGIDIRIGKYASKIGNESRSLEDFRTIFKLFDNFPQEDQLDMIRLFFAWSGNADDMTYTLRQRYLAQEVALIWEFSRLVSLSFGGEDAEEDLALFEDQLLIRRNQSWIKVLMQEAQGKSAFLAFGAAHLPDEHGILRLLEREGFTITRLPFNP